MRKEELIKLLEDNYINAGYKKEDIRMVRPFFNDLPRSLIEKLLNLEINEFSEYVNFIKRFSISKSGFYGYLDILCYLTSLIVDRFDSKNTRFLMSLLVETDIIENADVKEFIYLFMNEIDSKKASIIKKVLSFYNRKLARINISDLLLSINELDENTIEFLNEFLNNSKLRKDKNFIKYLDLFIEESNHENIDLFLNVLQNDNFRKRNDALEILRNFVFVRKPDFEHSKVVNSILTNEILVNSRYLTKILEEIENVPIGQYPYIKGLVKCADLVNEEVLYTLLKGLIESKTKGQGYSILKLVDYTKLHKNTIRLSYLIKIINRLSGDSLKELDNYLASLEKNKYVLEINPCDKKFSLILDSLSKVKFPYQASSIIDLSIYFNNNKSKYIIDNILNSKREEECIYLKKILTIKDLISNNHFELILSKISKIKSERHLSTFIRVCSTFEYLNLNNLSYILDTILEVDEFDLDMVDEFLTKVMKSSNKDLLLNDDIRNNNILIKLLRLYRSNLNYKQHISIISLLENTNIINNQFNLDYIINIIFDTKEGFKLGAIFKYLYANLKDLETINEDLKKYINFILETKENYQAMCLVLVSNVIKCSNYELDIVSTILESKSSVFCNYICTLLKIPNILENINFDAAFYELKNADHDFQMKGIIEVLNIPILADANLGDGIFRLINNCKTSKQVEVILRVLREAPSFYLEDLEFNLLTEILRTTDEKRLIALQEIFTNYNYLGYIKTDELVDKVMNYDTKEFKEEHGKTKFHEIANEIIDTVSKYNLVSYELENLGKNDKKLLKRFR